MRSAAWLLIGALGSAASAGESLGDVARRERERRQKLKEAGVPATPVITEATLRGNKGSLANDPGRPPAVTPPAASTPDASAGRSPHDLPAGEKKALEDSWRSQGNQARQRVEAAEKALAAANREHDDHSGAMAWDMAAQAERERRVAEARKDLEGARRALGDLEDAARQQGIPPGWLR